MKLPWDLDIKDELPLVGTVAQLKHSARIEAERIAADPHLPPGTTVVVVLARAPLVEIFAKGPYWKELGAPIAHAANEATGELNRKNA
jgi:hypothetical protein